MTGSSTTQSQSSLSFEQILEFNLHLNHHYSTMILSLQQPILHCTNGLCMALTLDILPTQFIIIITHQEWLLHLIHHKREELYSIHSHHAHTYWMEPNLLLDFIKKSSLQLQIHGYLIHTGTMHSIQHQIEFWTLQSAIVWASKQNNCCKSSSQSYNHLTIQQQSTDFEGLSRTMVGNWVSTIWSSPR